ncbi:MAG: SUMF1/EgtB/PvdO family nonheme iron enzyme [Prolixibacteraceae bacterium]
MNRIILRWCLLVALITCNSSVFAHDISWSDLFLAKKKIYQTQLKKHPVLFKSKVLKMEMSQKISVDISNQSSLVLQTWTTTDGNKNDDVLWINPVLIKNNGDRVKITKEMVVDHYGRKPSWTENRWGWPLKYNNKELKSAFYVNGNTMQQLNLNKQYVRFEATVAMDALAKKGKPSVQFIIGTYAPIKHLKELKEHYPIFTNLCEQSAVGLPYSLSVEDIDYARTLVRRMTKHLNDPSYFLSQIESAKQMPEDEQEKFLLSLVPQIDEVDKTQSQLVWIKPASIALALEDMYAENPTELKKAQEKLSFIKEHLTAVKKEIYRYDSKAIALAQKIVSYQRDLLLQNNLLDGDKLLTVRYHFDPSNARKVMAPQLGLPSNNWSGQSSKQMKGYNCELVELSNLRSQIKTKTLYKPKKDYPITDVQLHWDANRILFTSVSERNAWDLFELERTNPSVRRVTQIEEDDLDFSDGTYLPNGKIVMNATLGYHGVPCVNGGDKVANLALYDPKSNDLRRLNFGQDNDWDPVVMNNGKVMYLRWEYTDNTHYFSRIMMHMNPDGTNKKELYGSGSYWPNSMFDAQPIPNDHSNKFVAVVSGHHGIARSGRLVIFDPSKGRQEDKGVIQELLHKDRKVVPEIADRLVDGVWPQFVKPYPLNDKYFLVNAKLDKNAVWGLYLVDVFDNITPIAIDPSLGYCDVIPVRKREVPPVIPEKVNTEKKDATVYIQDIYEGQGLRGVPRGTVKKIRVFAYEYAYIKSPSNHAAQGIQSGWDIKRLLGTVPVEEDGSVIFKVPANLPISLQPLDEEGAAIQWMRSWMTAMPGEFLSCVGCHENQNTIARPKFTIASRKKPMAITPPEGGVRSFTFDLEVQPILDRRCIACHDGSNATPNFKDRSIDKKIGFGRSYLALHPYVRRQGPEADIHVMQPMEYHANTSDLIQMLKKGHHGVTLDDKEWKKLYNWIDFNAPYHGSFESNKLNGVDQVCRRQELMKKYNNTSVDWKKELDDYAKYLNENKSDETIMPKEKKKAPLKTMRLRHWPWDAQQVKNSVAQKETKTITLADGVSLRMVYIPKGTYISQYYDWNAEAMHQRKVKIKKGFWMSESEITNEQYKTLVPEHDSRFIAQQWKDHTTPGYAANKDSQPVIRVSWNDANSFCQMLSEKSGHKVLLPTEEQWEWAARSGSDQPFWFGQINSDFSQYENFADQKLADMAVVGVNPQPMRKNHWLRKYFDFIPRSHQVDDNQMLTAPVKTYQPNGFGLYDMLGNVAEWTRTSYNYYVEPNKTKEYKIVKGGSWRDRPEKSTAQERNYYFPWQRVTKVGFRVIIEQ